MKHKPIGGYFGLEITPSNTPWPFPDSILLNSGRACFEYILEANNAKHVYLPLFTCDVMLSPLEKLNIPYTFYSINEELEIADNIQLKDGDYLVYTNYFGAKATYCDRLSKKYTTRLIIDCSQAFYYKAPRDSHTFYSPRKFFGVPDGGILVTGKQLERKLEIDVSYKRMTHLLKRLELGPTAGYDDFKANDTALRGQPLKSMSVLTEEILRGVDDVSAKDQRNKNFLILHDALGESNGYTYTEVPDGPMCYVYRTTDKELRKKLIEQEIFVPTYWPNVFDWSDESNLEFTLASELLALPLDQRYDEKDMNRIIKAVNGR